MDRDEPRAEPTEVSPDTMEALIHLDWSENNIRQLRNTVELARDLAEGDLIDLPILERVLRIQRGESPEAIARQLTGEPGLAPDCLVRINSEIFSDLLKKETEFEPEEKRDRCETPFYRLQSEFQARAITEGLRSCRWKIRPAARLPVIWKRRNCGCFSKCSQPQLRAFLRVIT